MSCKGNNGSCGCKPLADASDEDFEKERMRRVEERGRRRSEAERRRARFFKQEYPMRFFWVSLPLLPLVVLFVLENLLPRIAGDYHQFFIYGTIFFTVVFICVTARKEMTMEDDFRKRFPEDAKALTFNEYEEW